MSKTAQITSKSDKIGANCNKNVYWIFVKKDYYKLKKNMS